MAATETLKQFNNYISVPSELLSNRSFPINGIFMLGDAFSFTGKSVTGEKLTCKRTYKKFQEKFDVSKPTVWRSIKKALKEKFVRRDKSDGYVFNTEKVSGAEFLRVPDWLHVNEFEVRENKKRKLLPSVRLVYSYIYTLCNNKKRAKAVCYLSDIDIAEKLGLDPKTVQRAIWALICAGLIYRQFKGVNGYRKSRYALNNKYIRSQEKAAKKQEKEYAQATDPRASMIAREDYYAQLHQRAERIADNNYARALLDPEFNALDKKVKSLSIKLAFATSAQAPLIKAEFENALKEKARRTQALGFTEESFEPQFKCKCCNDTGFKLDTGQLCECFPPGGKA